MPNERVDERAKTFKPRVEKFLGKTLNRNYTREKYLKMYLRYLKFIFARNKFFSMNRLYIPEINFEIFASQCD